MTVAAVPELAVAAAAAAAAAQELSRCAIHCQRVLLLTRLETTCCLQSTAMATCNKVAMARG
jgi:hypothetical protein